MSVSRSFIIKRKVLWSPFQTPLFEVFMIKSIIGFLKAIHLQFQSISLNRSTKTISIASTIVVILNEICKSYNHVNNFLFIRVFKYIFITVLSIYLWTQNLQSPFLLSIFVYLLFVENTKMSSLFQIVIPILEGKTCLITNSMLNWKNSFSFICEFILETDQINNHITFRRTYSRSFHFKDDKEFSLRMKQLTVQKRCLIGFPCFSQEC